MMLEDTMDVWVIIPAFNESDVIDGVLTELTKLPYQFVVVDDGSTDSTLEIALQHPVITLHHTVNMGQGAAIQTGISFALQHPTAQYIVTFDSDGQHRPGDIQRLVDVCIQGDYEVVLGSRFIQGGKAVHIGFIKYAILRIAVLFTRLMTGLSLTDTHNGLRLFTRQAAAQINITQNGMSHASQMLAQIASSKLRYHEIPVEITYTSYSRRKGQSVWNSINIIWDTITGRIK
jgi:glycosyltransferase involved in cell wall biosynthesis